MFTLKPTWLLSALVLVLFFGCDGDELKERMIREKLNAGQYDEAEQLARQYFADDKLVLLTTLSAIAERRDKFIKEAYRERLFIDRWDWSVDGNGLTKIAGRIINTGDKTVSGFALRIRYLKDGKAVRAVTHTKASNIDPGGSHDFVLRDAWLHPYDKLLIEIQDFALK